MTKKKVLCSVLGGVTFFFPIFFPGASRCSLFSRVINCFYFFDNFPKSYFKVKISVHKVEYCCIVDSHKSSYNISDAASAHG